MEALATRRLECCLCDSNNAWLLSTCLPIHDGVETNDHVLSTSPFEICDKRKQPVSSTDLTGWRTDGTGNQLLAKQVNWALLHQLQRLTVGQMKLNGQLETTHDVVTG